MSAWVQAVADKRTSDPLIPYGRDTALEMLTINAANEKVLSGSRRAQSLLHALGTLMQDSVYLGELGNRRELNGKGFEILPIAYALSYEPYAKIRRVGGDVRFRNLSMGDASWNAKYVVHVW